MGKSEGIKRLAAWLLALVAAWGSVGASAAQAPMEDGIPVELTAASAMLLEAETGTVIFEKNADEQRPVASVTKLMTLLLCMEELEAGRLSLEDKVTVSQNAAGQIGSQALLDAGAAYPLKDLLHATIIASANDAAVALAEHMAGTEADFAVLMNQRAQELGMTNTCYVNATGLPVDGQHTTARDVALLACEICRHPMYFDHAAVWMDTLTHPSGRTTDLTNTNRLIRFYEGCDGLKTGSADDSRYCLAATAQKDEMRLIAIVLGVPNSQTRFDEARAMLDYGFAGYRRIHLLNKGDLLGKYAPVHLGMAEQVEAAVGSGVSMLLKAGQEKQLALEVELPQQVEAPVSEGQTIGMVRVLLNGQVIAKVPAVAAQSVGMPGLVEAFLRIGRNWR